LLLLYAIPEGCERYAIPEGCERYAIPEGCSSERYAIPEGCVLHRESVFEKARSLICNGLHANTSRVCFPTGCDCFPRF
jgi:hypothetical protein